jgi:hypothetical protein
LWKNTVGFGFLSSARLVMLHLMRVQKREWREIKRITDARWTAYAAAAAATGLAAAHTAEATIHYSGLINQRVHGVEGFKFDLVSGVSLDVSHEFDYHGPSTSRGGGQAYFGIFGPGAAFKGAYFCQLNDFPSASKLNLRQPISGGSFFPGRALLAVRYGECHGYAGDGQFLEVGIGFVGFKFNTGAGDQFGWARIKILPDNGSPKLLNFTLVDYAYGDPGETVVAGQKKESQSSVPDLESVAGLAFGAAGLLAWRRGRRTAAH